MTCTIDFACGSAVACALREEQIQDLCDLVLRSEGVARECYVSVTIVSDDEIQELNKKWRGNDRPTDVLSLECERPDDPTLADGEPCELGDIVLAPDYIARQASAFGTTPRTETTLLVVHGMLHLLGYDHLEESEALVMEAREDELVALAIGAEALGSTTLTRHREEVGV